VFYRRQLAHARRASAVSPLSSVFASHHPRVDSKALAPALTPLESALTECDALTSLSSALTQNCRVSYPSLSIFCHFSAYGAIGAPLRDSFFPITCQLHYSSNAFFSHSSVIAGAGGLNVSTSRRTGKSACATEPRLQVQGAGKGDAGLAGFGALDAADEEELLAALF